ncbi:MAG: hypothetical protein QNJ14_02480 [Woeseiaceae bacterium]|nr:hypothetical protein [Woeseiaceae bacterium]
MLRSVSSVTFSAHRFDASCEVFEDFFGFDCIASGQLDQQIASFWQAPDAAGARCAVFQPPSGEQVCVRLVESPQTQEFQPLSSFGWNAAEFLVRDVQGSADRARRAGLEILGGPRDLLENGAAIALQVRGPSDEVFYLTELHGERMQATYGTARSEIDRVFIVVLGASDMTNTREFLARITKATPRPRLMTIRVLAAAHNLDPMTHKFPIASAVLEEQFRIEIDGYPESAVKRPVIAGHLPAGMAMVSFRVDSLDRIDGVTPQVIDGRRRALLGGPDGELLELLEAAR